MPGCIRYLVHPDTKGTVAYIDPTTKYLVKALSRNDHTAVCRFPWCANIKPLGATCKHTCNAT